MMAGTTATNLRKLALAHAQECVRRKDALEAELREIADALASQGVRPGDALVDAEGFPRADIDVYQVTHLRAQAARLRNDVKAATEQVKLALEAVHAAGPDPEAHQGPRRDQALIPFTKVNAVAPDSPADAAVCSWL